MDQNSTDKKSGFVTRVKGFLPQALKQKVRETLQEQQLSAALRAIKSLPPGTLPGAELLSKLERAWNNQGMSARIEYLQAVARHALKTEGPVLECGSGLTTLVLGTLAGGRGVNTYTLEDSPVWHQRMSDTLKRHHIDGVNNYLSPLKDYGDFSWYDPPVSNLPEQFRLIVCDGPPGNTKGGRYGLVPVMKSRLLSGTKVLLDDADREAEAEALRRWSELLDLEVSRRDQSRGEFAVITIRGVRA